MSRVLLLMNDVCAAEDKTEEGDDADEDDEKDESKQVSCHVYNCLLIVFSEHALYVFRSCAVAQLSCKGDQLFQ